MFVIRSIAKDIFEPLVTRVTEIEHQFFGPVDTPDAGERGCTMQGLLEEIRGEVHYLEDLFEGIKEDEKEVYESFLSVDTAVSEWQGSLKTAYQKASRFPEPLGRMKWAVKNDARWIEDDQRIGKYNEALMFDENELFESLRYAKTIEGGSEARLLENIKRGMEHITNVFTTIQSRKEAVNESLCIVEHVFSPLLKLLKAINNLVSEATARNDKVENYRLLTKVDAQVEHLQDALDVAERNKEEVKENFRVMEGLISCLLTRLKTAFNDQLESQSVLDEIKCGVKHLEGLFDVIEQKEQVGNDNFCIVKEAFSPLLTCLSSLRRLSFEALAHEDKLGARILLDKIKGEVVLLEDVLQKVHEKEKAVYNNFGAMEKHIDELLEGPMADAEGSSMVRQMGGLREKLHAIYEELTNIWGKVNDSFKVQEVSASSMPAGRATLSSHQSSSSDAFCIARESVQMWQLKLVIDGLETRLRHCLLCLAVFPEDAIIKKRLLIHWWIGEGFVCSVAEGKSFFDKLLISKGFIRPVKKEHCDKVHWCKVQPWIRGLLITIAKSTAFVELNLHGSSRNDFARTHRACLHAGKILTSFCRDVLTIYNISQQYVELDKTWFAGKAWLSTIQLGRWQDANYNPRAHHIEINNVKHLKRIESCKQLKYLSFRGISRIEALPTSIGKLRKLVILDLKACHNLEDLPKEIMKLEMLEYLDVSECYLLAGMPKGLGKLSRLEVLKGFVLANSRSKDPCHLSELATLPKLRKLSISIGYSTEKDQFQNFDGFGALRSLTLIWGVSGSPLRDNFLLRSSDATPHAMPFILPLGLEKLELCCFPLTDFPQWVRPRVLKSLKKLYIRGGIVSGLGNEKGWEVTVLRLRFLKHLNYSWTKLHDTYEKLNILEVCECSNLEPWPNCEKGLWRKELNGGAATIST